LQADHFQDYSDRPVHDRVTRMYRFDTRQPGCAFIIVASGLLYVATFRQL